MNGHKSDIQLLLENAKTLKLSLEWLKHSMTLSTGIKDFENPSIEQYDLLESLTARYARVTDILFNKVFRNIARVEMSNATTLLDVLLFMEKTGLVGSVERARYLKELRNDIVHEYFLENINELFENVFNHCHELVSLADRTNELIERLVVKYGI